MKIGILGHHPDKYFNVFFAPVLFYSFVFKHLFDPERYHAQDGLVTDVRGYHSFIFVEVGAVFDDIGSKFRFFVLF